MGIDVEVALAPRLITQTQVCLSVGRPPDAETEHPPDWWYLTELYIVNTFR